MDSPFSFDRPENFDVKKYIYHYTTIETTKLILSENGKLRLGQFINVNDPRESKFQGFSLSNKVGYEYDNTLDFQNKIRDYFKYRIKICCFSQDEDRISKPPYFNPEPFIRGYCKPRMWATYGDNHKGVCLVFDKSLLVEKFINRFKTNVFYGKIFYDKVSLIEIGWYWEFLNDGNAWSFPISELVEDFEGTLLKMIEKYKNSYFFKKNEDWSGENEFRLVLNSEKEVAEFFDYNDALVGVSVGMDCNEDSINAIRILANEKEIPMIKAIWSIQGWSQEPLNDLGKRHTQSV